MQVRAANNQTMVAIDTDSTTIWTDPMSVGGANKAEVACMAHSLFSAGGSPTLTWYIEGSNDGTNWFAVDNDPVTGPTTTPQNKEVSFSCAFVRFKFTLVSSGGSGGQITAGCFDIHANFTHT